MLRRRRLKAQYGFLSPMVTCSPLMAATEARDAGNDGVAEAQPCGAAGGEVLRCCDA